MGDGRTDRQTDDRPFHRPCSAYYVASVDSRGYGVGVLQVLQRGHRATVCVPASTFAIDHVLSFQVRSTSTPAYLNRHIQTCQRARDTRSSATPALFEPFTRTNCAKRAFRCSASAVWNSLPSTVLDCVTLSTFKSKRKTFPFSHTFTYN